MKLAIIKDESWFKFQVGPYKWLNYLLAILGILGRFFVFFIYVISSILLIGLLDKSLIPFPEQFKDDEILWITLILFVLGLFLRNIVFRLEIPQITYAPSFSGIINVILLFISGLGFLFIGVGLIGFVGDIIGGINYLSEFGMIDDSLNQIDRMVVYAEMIIGGFVPLLFLGVKTLGNFSPAIVNINPVTREIKKGSEVIQIPEQAFVELERTFDWNLVGVGHESKGTLEYLINWKIQIKTSDSDSPNITLATHKRIGRYMSIALHSSQKYDFWVDEFAEHVAKLLKLPLRYLGGEKSYHQLKAPLLKGRIEIDSTSVDSQSFLDSLKTDISLKTINNPEVMINSIVRSKNLGNKSYELSLPYGIGEGKIGNSRIFYATMTFFLVWLLLWLSFLGALSDSQRFPMAALLIISSLVISLINDGFTQLRVRINPTNIEFSKIGFVFRFIRFKLFNVDLLELNSLTTVGTWNVIGSMVLELKSPTARYLLPSKHAKELNNSIIRHLKSFRTNQY